MAIAPLAGAVASMLHLHRCNSGKQSQGSNDNLEIKPVGVQFGIYIHGHLVCVRPDEGSADRTVTKLRNALKEIC